MTATFRYADTYLDSYKPEDKINYRRAAQTLTFASTLSLPQTEAEETLFTLQLTGALTINAQPAPYIGDKIKFLFSTNGTGGAITWGTNMVSTTGNSLTIANNKYGSAEFQFDGNNWVETSSIATA